MRQKKGAVIQMALCLVMLGACLFSYLEKQNELTQLRIYVPKLMKEIKQIQEENVSLEYQIQKFESPENLMQLAADPKFSHLKYPLNKDILVLQDTPQIDWLPDPKGETYYTSSKRKHHTLAVGAK